MTWTLLETTAELWSRWMLVSLLESAVMLVIVLLVWRLIRKKCPQSVGYFLFLLVLIKLLIPIGVPLPELFAKYTPSHQISRIMTHHETNGIVTVTHVLNEQTVEPVTFRARPEMVAKLSPIFEPEVKTETVVSQEPVLASANTASQAHWPITVWLMFAWAAAVLFLLSRFVILQIRFKKSLRDRRLLDDPMFYTHSTFEKRVDVFACPNISTPAVYGLFRPMVLFPEEMLKRLSAEQLRWVLLHELAHIKRHDLQTAFLQRLAVMLHFYNPVVWVASHFMNHLRESACDDMALVADATIPRKKIGDALLNIVEYSAAVDHPISGTLGAFDFASSVRHRLVRLLDQKRILHTKTGVGPMILLILTTVLLVPQWQAMPTAMAVAENVVSQDDTNANNVSSKDEELRKALEERLQASQAEVAAVAEAYKEGRIDSEQFRDARIRLLQIELELLQKFPDSQIPDYSKRVPSQEYTTVNFEEQLFGAEASFEHVYAYRQNGLPQGTVANLAIARRDVVAARIAIAENRLRNATDDEQKTELTQKLKELYQDAYIAASLYFNAAAASFDVGRGTFDELSRSKKELAGAETRLKQKFPDVKIKDIDTKNIDYQKWYDELGSRRAKR